MHVLQEVVVSLLVSSLDSDASNLLKLCLHVLVMSLLRLLISGETTCVPPALATCWKVSRIASLSGLRISKRKGPPLQDVIMPLVLIKEASPAPDKACSIPSSHEECDIDRIWIVGSDSSSFMNPAAPSAFESESSPRLPSPVRDDNREISSTQPLFKQPTDPKADVSHTRAHSEYALLDLESQKAARFNQFLASCSRSAQAHSLQFSRCWMVEICLVPIILDFSVRPLPYLRKHMF